jgi:hypothetical protein
MQRFQISYNLKAIPEVQEYLDVAFENSRHHGDLQDLYRRRYVVRDMIRNRILTWDCVVYWLNPDSPLIHHLPEICGNFSTGQLVLYRNQHPHRRDQILSSSLELPGLTHNILPGLLHFIGMVFGACFVLPSSHVFPQHCSPTACHHNYIYIAVSILPVCNDYSHLKDL